VVTELDDKLKEFFRDKSYGPDVENFTIGIILTSPDVDHLHPVRGLKYRKHLVFKHPPRSLPMSWNTTSGLTSICSVS
jgi:hypothetical protein